MDIQNEETLAPVYLSLLEKWLKNGQDKIYYPSFDKSTACYGPGDHGHWSIQANGTVFAGLATMATDPSYNEKTTGIPKDELLNLSLKLLRFAIRGHKASTGTTYDGEKWGGSWISALAIERMMHGIEAIEEYLTPQDTEQLRDILTMESNWLLDEYEIIADIDANRNRPESNIWNGAILHRTAMMFPDLERVNEYKEKGTKFLLNGISVPEDATDNKIYDGRSLTEWHVGPNFTSNYGLHHHGYLNVGYMVICLSNIAMLHFSYKKRGLEAPEALYHHAEELWKVIKAFTFDDGRLWRIGGDTRVRYCYCQDYAIPMWLLAMDKFHDQDAYKFEQGWLEQVAKEQNDNRDKSFLSERLTELEEVSPLYYTRLEGDRVVTLSMGAYWRRIYDEFKDSIHKEISADNSWSDDYHMALMERGEKRMASFVWESCQRPMGQCLPTSDSSMAEWRWNTVGEINGCAHKTTTAVISNNDHKFEGGFATCGEFEWWSKEHVAEGSADEITAVQQQMFAALPDDNTIVVMQKAQTIKRTYLRTVKGLFLNIPNDVFNDKSRSYEWEGDSISLDSMPEKAEKLSTCNELTIDNILTVAIVYGSDKITINRPGSRQVEIYNPYAPPHGRSGGNLYCDEICSPCITDRNAYEKDTVLFDQCFTISIGKNALTTIELDSHENMRAISVIGEDGKQYIVCANFSHNELEYEVKEEDTVNLVDNKQVQILKLAAMDCAVLRVNG